MNTKQTNIFLYGFLAGAFVASLVSVALSKLQPEGFAVKDESEWLVKGGARELPGMEKMSPEQEESLEDFQISLDFIKAHPDMPGADYVFDGLDGILSLYLDSLEGKRKILEATTNLTSAFAEREKRIERSRGILIAEAQLEALEEMAGKSSNLEYFNTVVSPMIEEIFTHSHDLKHWKERGYQVTIED